MRQFACVLACAVLCAQCTAFPPPWPFQKKKTYSSDIGVPGVPLTAGQLAGTWYGQVEFATVIKLPIVGNRNAGANGGRLITLTWDEARGTYDLVNRWCWDDVFEVEGTRNTFTDDTLHALRPSHMTVHAELESGHVWTDKFVDLWGVQNLPDPENTPLPNKDSYQNSPESGYMLDEDQDSHPGVTVHIAGNFNGEGYIVNRAVFAFDGVAKSVDELVGLVPADKLEQKMVDSTIRIGGQSAGVTDQWPDPDPKASWFQLVRGVDGATCTEVLAARDSGRLGQGRPF